MSHLLVTSGLFESIDARLKQGMPVFGTCAGMILLSRGVLDGRPDQRSFGAIDIDVRRNAYGRQVDSFEADLMVSGLDLPFHAVFIRAPLVTSVQPGVEVLATLPADGRIVAVRDGRLLATSFHPELTTDNRIHRLFLDMCAAA